MYTIILNIIIIIFQYTRVSFAPKFNNYRARTNATSLLLSIVIYNNFFSGFLFFKTTVYIKYTHKVCQVSIL